MNEIPCVTCDRIGLCIGEISELNLSLKPMPTINQLVSKCYIMKGYLASPVEIKSDNPRIQVAAYKTPCLNKVISFFNIKETT